MARRPLKFYTGFPTYYVRIAPHAMITLMVLDAIQSFQSRTVSESVATRRDATRRSDKAISRDDQPSKDQRRRLYSSFLLFRPVRT